MPFKQGVKEQETYRSHMNRTDLCKKQYLERQRLSNDSKHSQSTGTAFREMFLQMSSLAMEMLCT